MFSACLLAFSTGFLSLSQEIIWIRLVSFVNHSIPQSFAFVLTFYLIGIAVGSQLGKKLCSGTASSLWKTSGIVLIISSFFDFIAPWIYVNFAYTSIQLLCGGLLILLTALLKAIIFPIAHHLSAPSAQTIGRSISRVYVSNIMGATLGPIVISILMLSFFTTQQCFVILAALAYFLGIFCLKNTISFARLILSATIVMIFLGFILTLNPLLLITNAATPGPTIKQIVETPQGIITIYAEEQGGDVIYGGNVYDGRTNLDPVINSNGIERILILAALHDRPKRILIIGLSIGSWLKLVTSFPGVENIDVVEINPGYLRAIKNYIPQYSTLLDPRVHIHIDDGRRWLNTHPDNRYDIIIMNTTYHWRAYGANLLSQEFLTLVKNHMNQHAIYAYNTTSSLDAFKTATVVFPHAYLYKNFVIAADFDWRHKLQDEQAKKKLLALSLDGKFLFASNHTEIVDRFLAVPIKTIESLNNTAENHVEVVTDDNLITEYKHGK